MENENLEESNKTYEGRVVSKIDNSKGCWKSLNVGVFEIIKQGDQKIETQIGEYNRNYSSLMDTFCPFKLGNSWYALYSKHYMYTRVMSLPDCKDLGGEEDSNVEYKNHFCPMEYYVPTVCFMDFKPGEEDPLPYNPRHDYKKWSKKYKGWLEKDYYSVYPDDKKADKCFTKEEIEEYKRLIEISYVETKAWDKRHPFVTKYTDFGFVSGCRWGDDTSSKIEFLDLRRAPEGIIKRDSRFGYVELPDHVSLKYAIEIRDDDCYKYMTWADFKVQIAVPAYFNINSGKKYKEDLDDWWSDNLKGPTYESK